MSNIMSSKNESFSEKKLDKRTTSFKSTSEKKKRYSDSYNIIIKELKIIKKIDEGAYGEVKLAKYQGNMVALKYFKKNGKAQEQLIEEFTKEIKALDKLRHPNILFYMGYFYEKNNFVMVSQFASMGSLYNLLHKKKKNLIEEDIIKIIRQIVQAMIYTHSTQSPNRRQQHLPLRPQEQEHPPLPELQRPHRRLRTRQEKELQVPQKQAGRNGALDGARNHSVGQGTLTEGGTPTRPVRTSTPSVSWFGKW